MVLGDWWLITESWMLSHQRYLSYAVIDELLDELAHAKWFTKLDLRAGYHQIRMAPVKSIKQLFGLIRPLWVYRYVLWAYWAPATFQGAMNETLSPVLRKFALVFLMIFLSIALISHLTWTILLKFSHSSPSIVVCQAIQVFFCTKQRHTWVTL